MEWAIRITEKINQIGEVPSALWMSVMSPRMGTLAWTAVVSELAVIEETEAKLSTDPGYLLLVDEAIPLLSAEPADQRLMQLVYADPDAATFDAHYAATVTATLAPGNMRTGIELGAEIARRAKQITGRPTTFGVSVTGTYGEVMWVTLAETIQQIQGANEALDADEDFAKSLDKDAAKAYLPNATQTISRKIM
jgi:hypothetical protein